jgi:hypothetical protein
MGCSIYNLQSLSLSLSLSVLHFTVLQVYTGVLKEHIVAMFRLEGMGSRRK